MHSSGEGREQADHPETPDTALSRRSLIRGAAGVGAATVAAGFLASALAEPAAAAQPAATGQRRTTPSNSEPIVAHVRDASTGEIDLFVGTEHIRVQDHDLAARLARAIH